MKPYINVPEYNVTQFNNLFKKVVEENFNYIRVKGEISEIKIATRGQLYLTLKDDSSILSGVLWDTKKKYLEFALEEGMEVIVIGKITTWSKFKTTYQIDIDKVELAGEGGLLKLIENRKKKLKDLGVFDQVHKKKIPYLPNKIGVITSPTGSVIHDIINRIKDRCPIHIDIWPVAVQGLNAVDNIIDAIKGFNSERYQIKPDVIIIARGGGSTEDLMTFNDENLALAVFKSDIPIISAIGHETDTTIIDFVSDLRASTPTAAAEKAVPVLSEILQTIESLSNRLDYIIENNYNNYDIKLLTLSKYLKAPDYIINIFKEKINLIANNLTKETNSILFQKINKLTNFAKLLRFPKYEFTNKKKNYQILIKSIDRQINYLIFNAEKKTNALSRLLRSNSINTNLNKGYSVIRKSKKIIKSSTSIGENDLINIQLSDKSIEVKIKKLIKSIVL